MVKKIINKPYLFFFGLIPVAIVFSFINGNETINFNISELYFVSELKFLYYISAIFFMMIGINYLSLNWANKPPKKWLTIIHLFLQLLALVFLVTRNNWNWIGKEYSENLYVSSDNSSILVFISILIFILSVFFHLINFFTSLFLKTE